MRNSMSLATADAVVRRADELFAGIGRPRDMEAARSLLVSAAREKHPVAQGWCVLRGVDYSCTDVAPAPPYGDDLCCSSTGSADDFFESWIERESLRWRHAGSARKPDPTTAVALFEEARTTCVSAYVRGMAIELLAECYDHGAGVSRDENVEVSLYRIAADLGHPIAINNLAFCFLHGYVVDTDAAEAVRLWQQAAELGSSGAAYRLSQILRDEDSTKPIKRDKELSLKLLKRSADGFHPSAELALAQTLANPNNKYSADLYNPVEAEVLFKRLGARDPDVWGTVVRKARLDFGRFLCRRPCVAGGPSDDEAYKWFCAAKDGLEVCSGSDLRLQTEADEKARECIERSFRLITTARALDVPKFLQSIEEGASVFLAALDGGAQNGSTVLHVILHMAATAQIAPHASMVVRTIRKFCSVLYSLPEFDRLIEIRTTDGRRAVDEFLVRQNTTNSDLAFVASAFGSSRLTRCCCVLWCAKQLREQAKAETTLRPNNANLGNVPESIVISSIAPFVRSPKSRCERSLADYLFDSESKNA